MNFVEKFKVFSFKKFRSSAKQFSGIFLKKTFRLKAKYVYTNNHL